MATVAVIKKAKSLGCDMVITHEPTFFSNGDEWYEGPMGDAKREFLNENAPLTIWRWHDRSHWCSGMHPVFGKDEISESFTRALEWEQYRIGEVNDPEQNRYEIPPCTLREIGRRIHQSLQISEAAIRIAGDLDATFTKVRIWLGYASEDEVWDTYEKGEVEVAIVGECPEWCLSEYVRDSCELGIKRGFIMLGHRNSEEHGMKRLVDWLQKKLGDRCQNGVHYVPSKEPFQTFSSSDR
eukprot:gnl/MRDRNA2_/MRDRNA2_126724_c0_seq1.p1 gnl/MRDRNA2_/MRDRNA2_126724_c0~~gnl/MRDRNA2_/MRDRNA2_126724_c0_seq1.p1  ORF type:complete len:275 (+),score=30.03 gnl/MRDRNA2_/MRDRNA2_126724_c0_seq1:110-826(+)